MSRSLRTDPYPLRAARRGRSVAIRSCPARPGFVHDSAFALAAPVDVDLVDLAELNSY